MALSDCLEKIHIEQDIADFMRDRSSELVDNGMDQLAADRQVVAEMFQDIEETLDQIGSQLKINRDGSPLKKAEFAGEILEKKKEEPKQKEPEKAVAVKEEKKPEEPKKEEKPAEKKPEFAGEVFEAPRMSVSSNDVQKLYDDIDNAKTPEEKVIAIQNLADAILKGANVRASVKSNGEEILQEYTQLNYNNKRGIRLVARVVKDGKLTAMFDGSRVIFVNSQRILSAQQASVNIFHELLHKGLVGEERLVRLYDSLGESIIRRLVPDEYFNYYNTPEFTEEEKKRVLAEEFLTHFIEIPASNINFVTKFVNGEDVTKEIKEALPEGIQEVITGLIKQAYGKTGRSISLRKDSDGYVGNGREEGLDGRGVQPGDGRNSEPKQALGGGQKEGGRAVLQTKQEDQVNDIVAKADGKNALETKSAMFDTTGTQTRFSISTIPQWEKSLLQQDPVNGPVIAEIIKRAAGTDNALAAMLSFLGGSPVRGNSDYIWTLDMDTKCPKQINARNYDIAVTEILGSADDFYKKKFKGLKGDKFDDAVRPFRTDERWAIVFALAKAGVDAPCPICYVEAKRMPKKEYGAAGGVTNVPKEYSPYTNQFLDLAGPHKVTGVDFYSYMNFRSGMRFLSNTDGKPSHIIDLAQAIADLTVTGGMAHAYTKTYFMAKVFAPTGLVINLSMFPKIIKGKMVFDPSSGHTEEFVSNMMLQYPETTGGMAVATNDEIVWQSLDHDLIKMIIPYHSSGLRKDIFEVMRWQDYSKEQKEEYKNLAREDNDKRKIYEAIREVARGKIGSAYKALDPVEKYYVDGLALRPSNNGGINKGKSTEVDAKNATLADHYIPPIGVFGFHKGDRNTYLELAKQYGLHPKFDGRTKGHPDFTVHDNYMKLINDTVSTTQKPVDITKMNLEAAEEVMDQFIKAGGQQVYLDTNEIIVNDAVKMIQDMRKKGTTLADQIKDYSEELYPEPAIRFSLAPPTESKEFKEWFKDSKVVDKDGKPLKVYHGAFVGDYEEEERFHVFDGLEAIGWFAEKREKAEHYNSRGWMYEVYLSIQKPFYLKGDMNEWLTPAEFEERIGFKLKKNQYTSEFEQEEAIEMWEYVKENITSFQGQLRKMGYDGIKVQEGGYETWAIIKDQAQVKSATGNIGTFDKENPDIRFSLGYENKPYQEFSDAMAIKAEKAALKAFPTTEDWNKVGWLTISGKKLDFSGNDRGNMTRGREMDHREVNEIMSDYDLGKYDTEKKWVGSNSTGMLAFMDMGNIRVSPESKGLAMHTMPSNEQFREIRDFIGKYNGEIILDLNNNSVEYEKWTEEEKIVDDIKNFYREGVVPQGDYGAYDNGIRFSLNNENDLVPLQYESEEERVKDSLDGYESQEVREQTVDKAVKETEGKYLNTGRGAGKELFPKVKRRTVLESFKESGYVDFVGQKVDSPQDIADLWSIHRSPNIEKSHAIFVKNGKIVGTTATTVNHIGMSMFLKPEQVLDLYNKFGADGMYFLHNHPSGNHKPSVSDVMCTKNQNKFLASNGAKLLGHIIIDTGKFSLIDVNKNPVDEDIRRVYEVEEYISSSVEEIEYKNPVAKLFSDREQLTIGGDTQARMIEIAKALLTENNYKGAVVYLSSNLEVTAYDVFPEGATADNIQRIARDGLANNLGRSVVFIHDGSYRIPLSWTSPFPANTLDVIDTVKMSSVFFNKEKREDMDKMLPDILWEQQLDYPRKEQPAPQFAGEYLDNMPRFSLIENAAERFEEKKAIRSWKEAVQEIREYIQDLSLPIRRFEEEVLRRGGKQDNSSKPYRDTSLSFGRMEKLYEDYRDKKFNPILEVISELRKAGVPGKEIFPYIIAKHAMERNPVFRNREMDEWNEKRKAKTEEDRKEYQKANPKASVTDMTDWDLARQVKDQNDRAEFYDTIKDKDYSGVMEFDADENGKPLGNYTSPDVLASTLVAQFESKVDQQLVNKLWDKVRTASNETLDTWEKGNRISSQQKADYLKQFNFFVPLRGWRKDMEKQLDYVGPQGKVGSNSLKHAKGRKSLAENPLAYMLGVQFQAISEQVDNEVKTAMLNLILRNLNNNEIHDLATLKKLYYYWDENEQEWVPTTVRPSQDKFDNKTAKTKLYHEHERLRKPANSDQHEVIVHKPGGDMVMVFKDKGLPIDLARENLSVAQALNKQNYLFRTIFGNVWDTQRGIHEGMVQTFGALNNTLKAMYTSWNVIFPFTNFMRDFQEATITQAIKSGTGLKTAAQYKGAFGAITRRMMGKPDMSQKIDRDLEDFYNAGGATGYTHTKTIDEIQEDVNKTVRRMVRTGTFTGTMANMGRKALTGIEYWNRLFEDATRFSVFRSSLAAGNTIEDAASDAKEASVNFNRKGKGSKAWDSYFAFFNVAIQSLQKNLKLAKDHTGKFTAVATSFIMLGFFEAMMNAMTDDDDEDASYYNLNPYMRQNYLIIPLPKTSGEGKANKYISIPLPQFWRGFKSMGAIAFDVATGKMKAKEAVIDALGNFGSALLPVDIGGFYKSGEFSISPLVPTVVKPVVEVIENKNYMGYSIKNEPFTRDDKAFLANAGLGKNNVNPAAKFLTDMLFRWGGGEGKYKYYKDENGEKHKVPFLMDLNPSTIEHLWKGYTGGTGGSISDLITTVAQGMPGGDAIDYKNVPFVNKFIRKTPEAKWNIKAEFYNQRDDYRIGQKLEKQELDDAMVSGDWREVNKALGNDYVQQYKMLFQMAEKELDYAAKEKAYDFVEGSKRAVEIMERTNEQIKVLKEKYNRK